MAHLSHLLGTAGCQTAPSGPPLRLLVPLLGESKHPVKGQGHIKVSTRSAGRGSPQTVVRLAQGLRRCSSRIGGTTESGQKVLLVNCASTGLCNKRGIRNAPAPGR